MDFNDNNQRDKNPFFIPGFYKDKTVNLHLPWTPCILSIQ